MSRCSSPFSSSGNYEQKTCPRMASSARSYAGRVRSIDLAARKHGSTRHNSWYLTAASAAVSGPCICHQALAQRGNGWEV